VEFFVQKLYIVCYESFVIFKSQVFLVLVDLWFT